MLNIKKLLTKILQQEQSANTIGNWTPHIYDYNTLIRSMTVNCGTYIKIGKFCVAAINASNVNLSGINTMLQIRNLPMNTVIGGNLYIGNMSGNAATITIQLTGGTVLFRPNITSSQFSNPSNVGYFTAMIIGYN